MNTKVVGLKLDSQAAREESNGLMLQELNSNSNEKLKGKKMKRKSLKRRSKPNISGGIERRTFFAKEKGWRDKLYEYFKAV